MLALCSGLSHYFPDAFSNKYVLPSVTELLKQRSLQHRSIVYSFSSLQEYVELEFCSNERQSPNETQSSPPASPPRTAAAAAADGGLRRLLRRRRRQRGWRRRRLRVYAVVTLEASSSPAENTGL